MAGNCTSEEFLQHRGIARWLQEYFDETDGIRARLEAERKYKDPEVVVGNAFMQPDSDMI